MEDLPIGSEIVLKVVKTEKEQCNGCFFDEICNNIYENVCGDFDCSASIHCYLDLSIIGIMVHITFARTICFLRLIKQKKLY